MRKHQSLSGIVRPYYGGGRAVLDDGTPAPKAFQAADALVLPTPPRVPQVPSRMASHDSTRTPTSLTNDSPAPEPHRTPHDAPTAIRAAAAAAGWPVTEIGPELQIDVPTGQSRSQIVAIRFDQADQGGLPLTTITSACGPLSISHAAPLLRYNAKLTYGAFAVERTSDQEETVFLRVTLPACCTDMHALARVIGEIAARADRIEGKLTGDDRY